MLIRLIIRIVINAVALAVAAWAVEGIAYKGIGSLVVMALIFGLVNAIIRPIVKIFSIPLLILTLGLFTFVINGLMLLLAGKLAEMLGVSFTVNGFVAAFLGALIVSVVSLILSIALAPPKRHEE